VTPEQVTLVQRSFADLADHQAADAMAARFYERLFSLDPDVRRLFSTDPAVQRAKFVDELAAIVAAISNLDRLLDLTHDLGARHVGYGVSARHYRVVGEALLGALGDELGDGFDDDVATAWARAYSLVAETMLHGADQADA
jgi:nitric oxide dioxygenase